MNKRAAKKATDDFEGTIGDLRAMIARRRPASGVSNVNPGIDLERALGVYEAALDGRADDEKVVIWRNDPYSRSGGVKRTKDSLIVQNIFRDCA